MWLWWRGRGCGLGISLLLVLGLVKFVLPFTTTSCLPALQQARTGCKYSPSMLSQQSRGFLASRSIRQENAMKLYLSSSGNSVERLGLNPPNYLLNYLKTATTKSSVKSSILISVADVVANTGKPFPTVRRDLLALAVSTGAGLQVTEEGELLFRFPINFSSILQQRSFRYRLKQSYGVVAPYVNQLVRASYGVGLIASLLIVTMAISGLSSSKHNDEDDSRHSNNRNHHRRHHHSHHNNGMSMQVYIDLNSVFNLIFARDHPNGDNMSLLDACYSFLFGDGDPNQNFELTLSQSIAEFIRQQEGVVIAEQLAYFIPSPPLLPAVLSSSAPTTSSELSLQLNQQNQIVDESWILPTLLRYNGRPTVTEDGHIVYIFDELMLSAANLGTTAPPTTEVNSGLVRNPILLSEQEWKFSQAPPAQLGKVTLLATANLVGIIMLSQMLPQSNLIRGKHKEMAYFIQKAFPFLATYAAGFVGFPIIRYFNIKRRNKEIRERNTERKKWFEIVNSMIALKKQSNQKEEINTTLLDKLKSREAYLDTQVRPRVKETPTKIVYDTDISLDQQETIK